MSEISSGLDNVANTLLEFFGARKSAIANPLPDKDIVRPYFKDSAGSGGECHFFKAIAKGL